MGIHTF